jgi:hypothetical protein
VYRVFVSPSHCFCLTVSGGVLSSVFLSGGRLDDRNYAISGVFRPIRLPSDPSPGWPRLTETHRIGVSKAGSPQIAVRGQNFTRSQGLSWKAGAGVPRMSVLGTIGICWLGLNGAVFAALATRKSRPRLRARLFNWVVRNERASFSRTVAFTRSSALHRGTPRSLG